MSEENNNNQPIETATETVKIAEPDFSSYKDFRTILDKLNIKDAPVSATISAQDCPIDSVNVFSSGTGSEVTRTVTTKLPAGLHKVVITDLSPLAYDLNFRLGGKKGFLLDVNLAIHEEPRPVDPKKIERQNAKKEKITKLNEERTKLGIEIANNRTQTTWLNDYANKAKDSLGSTVKIEDAVNFMNFYGERIKALHTEAAELEAKLKQVNERLSKLTAPKVKPQIPQQPQLQLKSIEKEMYFSEKSSKISSYKSKAKTAVPNRIMKKEVINRKNSFSDSSSESDDDDDDDDIDNTCGTATPQTTRVIRTKRMTATIFLSEKTKLRLHASYQLPNLTYQISYETHYSTTSTSSELLYYATLINASGEKLVIEKDTKVTVTDGKYSQYEVTHPANVMLSVNLSGRDDTKMLNRFMSLNSTSSSAPIPMTQVPIQSQPPPITSTSSSSIFSRNKERSHSSVSAPPVNVTQPVQPPPQVAVTTQSISIKDYTLSMTIPVILPEYTPLILESNSEQQRLLIGTYKFTTNMIYTCLPKASQYAFLQAVTNNSSSIPLFRGQVKIFVDNHFVQTSYITFTNPKDEFSLLLGYDPEIQVEYKQEQTVESKSSKTKQVNLISTISIKNKKSNDIELQVFDVVPLSVNTDVKINVAKPNLKEDKSVSLVEGANQLKWTAKVAAGKSFAAQSHYQIEAPLKGEVTFQ